jgi:tRNA dimethylallyltransferase
MDCPPSVPAFREKMQEECDQDGSDVLHNRLKLLDPEAASKIHPHDKIRIIRALEIIHLTHERPSSLMRKHGFRQSPFRTLKICLQMDRKQLYHRINERSLFMIENGLVGETEKRLFFPLEIHEVTGVQAYDKIHRRRLGSR